MGMYDECLTDYATVAASQTKAALGPGSKIAVGDGDVLERIIIIPATTSPGAVTLYDGAGGTGIIIFPGGASSIGDLKAIYLELGMRAKNAAANANGPRWLITTGASVSVVAVGRFL